VIRHRWAAFAVLTTITLAACSGGGNDSAGGRVDSDATVSSVAESMEDLEKVLDLAVPEGFVRQPDSVGDTGPSDLEKASRDDGGDDARDVLTKTRFVRGYQRMWTRSGDEIVSYVYQFADTAGAVEYTNRLNTDSLAPTEGVSISPFDVPNVTGAVGVNTSEPTVASSSVTFVKGPYSVEIVVSGPTPTGLEALVTALAEEQYSRL
jgi:hypothetical protein